MRFSDAGFLRWTAWAFFSWQGRIKRLPYAATFFALVLVVRAYATAAAQWMAVNVLPPPPGVALDPAYVAKVATSPEMAIFLLPVCYIYIVLDVKRLRSIGAPLALAFVFSGLTPFVPLFAPTLAQIIILTTFAYHAILAVVPAAEDRVSPLERKAGLWRSLATGTGMPRRLRGADIKFWRIVRQGPAKDS